jgi:glycosyltransferase involved in cell wall biosynthesis
MKIVHVLGALDYGGVETHALSVIEGLAPPDFSHVVIDMSESGGPRETDFAERASMQRCPYVPGQRSRFVRRCARLLKTVKPDRVVAYNFGNHALVAYAAALASVPACFVSVQASPVRDLSTRWKSGVLAHLARPVCRGEIAVSFTVQRELIKGLRLPSRRVTVIRNSCAVDELLGRAKAVAGQQEDRPRSPLRLLMVSRMDDAKDHPTLFRTVRKLIDAGIDTQLELAGSGPREGELRALASDLGLIEEIRFLGNRRDIPELHARNDILVHSTKTEGLGVALLEGMATGIPIVASDIGSCREALEDGASGLLVAPGDPQAMATAIRRLHEDPSLGIELSKRAAAFVRANFSNDVMLADYRRLLIET